MRIPCPLCGKRDHGEFTYHGAAGIERPDPQHSNAVTQFCEYVYLRDNPSGWHRELWYHRDGCRSWLVIERNTASHEVRGGILAGASETVSGSSQSQDEGGDAP